MAEDPLYDAEAQMVEYEVAAFRDLFLQVSRRLPDTSEPTEEQITAVLREVIAKDPRARDLAERIGVLQAFRSKQREQEGSE